MAADPRTRNPRRRLLLLLGLAVFLAAGALGLRWQAQRLASPSVDETLPEPFVRLIPLHNRLCKAEPGDWLSAHPEQPQSYERFARVRQLTPSDPRRALEILPLGDFRPDQQQLIEEAADFVGRYYQLPVRLRPALPLPPLPEDAQRRREDGHLQIRTGYLLNEVLIPRRSEDALALLGFTTLDVYPSEEWNCVFGEAMPSMGVGVWSLYHFGDPEESPEESPETARLLRLRTLKTAAHELGHLLGLNHCTFYECCMDGSNHLGELDRHPLELCPQCLAKACCRTEADPWKRCEELLAFAQAQGWTSEASFWQKARQTLGTQSPADGGGRRTPQQDPSKATDP